MGAQDRARGEVVFNQAFVMSALVGLAFGVVAFALRGVYIRALAADAATAEQGIRYLTWFVPAMTLQFGLVALGSALRGIGDMKIPTMIQVGTVLINIALAPVLTVGWLTGRPLGVTGAALASLIAILLGAVAYVFYFNRPSSPIRFRPREWRPQLPLWSKMLGIGLPTGGEFALLAVYIALVYNITQEFGSAAQAGFGVGVRLMQSLFLPAVAIGFATAPVVGQNFGAREAHRVRQTFLVAAVMSSVVMLLMTAICQIAPERLVGAFSDDRAVVMFGAEYLRIISWNFAASGIIFAGSSALQGIGNTRPALFASLLRLVLFAVPSIWLSRQPGFEMRYVWYISLASVFAHMGILLWLVRRQFAERLRW
jgi:putative MATE family efflux protein